jgi:hypothetical protein
MGKYVVLMCGLNIRSQNRITEPEQRAALDTVAGDLALVRMVEDKGTYLVTSEHPASRVADLAVHALSSHRPDLKINGPSLPSHAEFESLFIFARDFYEVISRSINEIGPALIPRTVAHGFIKLMKSLGVEDPRFDFEDEK